MPHRAAAPGDTIAREEMSVSIASLDSLSSAEQHHQVFYRRARPSLHIEFAKMKIHAEV